MGKKFIYNILLNVGIIVLFFLGLSAYQSAQYFWVVVVGGFIVLFIILKYRLLKVVKASIRDHSKLR